MNNFNLDTLNPMQLEAVKHFKGPLLILAGAGSGKTRVITHRVAYLITNYNVKPWNILALTFTNKAAGEMKERVALTCGEDARFVSVSTFHSLCVRILRRNAEAIGYGSNFTIYDSDDQKTLMRRVLKQLNLESKKNQERAYINVISGLKDKLISPMDFAKEAENDFQMKKYVEAYKEYQKELKAANAFDFDDLIFKTVELFSRNTDILRYYQDKFHFIMVDEYQDTNFAQFRLVNLLANHLNENNENEKNLCVVGDDDQSIYKFRGADITNILNFEEHYPNTKVIKLEQNYRSTANILDAANAVIKNNNGRKPKALWTDKGEGEPIYYKLFESDLNESFGVVDSIMSAVDNGYANYNDFAVLYRTNAQSRSLEEAMIRQNIPYRIVGGINFYQRREIKDILAYLRIIDNSTDSVSINRIINVPKRGIGTASIEKITNYSFENGITFFDSLHEVDNINGISRAKAKLKDFTQLIDDYNEMVYEKGISIVELIDTIIETSEYDTYLYDEDPEKYDDRMENINELKSKAKSYEDENGEDASLSGFLADVSLIADIDTTDETIDNVLLMTLHSAKGLEFPYVFIVGMEDNLFPSYGALNSLDYNESIEAIEEERRLAYVGITRAMKKLALSGAISRFRNGNYEHNEPSMFYREIPDHLINTFSQRLMPFGDDVGKRVIHKAPGQFSSISTKESDNKIFTFTRAGATQKQTRRPKIGTLESLAFSSSKNTSLPQQNFDVGDRVKHKKFGDGTITDVTPKGNDKVISVSFDDGKSLKLIASFSKLEKI